MSILGLAILAPMGDPDQGKGLEFSVIWIIKAASNVQLSLVEILDTFL